MAGEAGEERGEEEGGGRRERPEQRPECVPHAQQPADTVAANNLRTRGGEMVGTEEKEQARVRGGKKKDSGTT